jgi:hypothetical protein
MCCHFYRSPYMFHDAFVNAIQDDFKYISLKSHLRFHLTQRSAMNLSSFGGQITMKYRRDKEVSHLISLLTASLSMSLAIVILVNARKRLSHLCKTDARFVKVLVNIKRLIEKTVDSLSLISDIRKMIPNS